MSMGKKETEDLAGYMHFQFYQTQDLIFHALGKEVGIPTYVLTYLKQDKTVLLPTAHDCVELVQMTQNINNSKRRHRSCWLAAAFTASLSSLGSTNL